MTRVLFDIRFALRSLTKRPAFSLLVVVILGLGLGATTALVDLTNLLAWRPIPVDQPDELVKIYTAGHQGFVTPYRGTGFADYVDYRDAVRSFTGLAAHDLWEFRVDTGEATELWWTAGVTGNFFDVLELGTSLGRALTPEDDRTGTEPVVVLSYDVWKKLGSDREILGRSLTIEGKPATIVGVAARGFRGTDAGNRYDLFMPLAATLALLPDDPREYLDARYRGSAQLIGRLAEGQSLKSAQAELGVLAQQLDHDHPMDDDHPRQVTVTKAIITHPIDVERMTSTMSLFAAAVALLLLITCANVAHLLLSHAMGRRREMAVRLSIGAGRRILIRQLLTESLLLALAGGVVGVGVARGVRVILTMFTGPEFTAEMQFDWRVLGATFLACLVVTLLFGLAPALAATRVELTSALKDGAGSGHRHFLAGHLLGAGQVALCMVLLVAGTQLVRSLNNRLGADLGFDDDEIYIARLTLPENGYSPEQGAELFRSLEERTRALPGVESAGIALLVPPIMFDITVPIRLPGLEEDAAASRINLVDAGYFDAMGIDLHRGRMFDAGDTETAPSAAIVNELLAEELFPGEDPIGRTLQFTGRNAQDPGPDHVIVGVVENVTQQRAKPGGEPTVYFPWSQWQRPNRQLVVRSSLNSATVFESMRATLRDLDPNLALFMMRTGPSNRREAFVIERMQAQAVGVFAVVGFVLALIGIFGVLSYSVSRRVREIGIRMAIGAQAADVRRQVVVQGLRVALAGALVGTVATLFAARFLENLLYGVAARDLWVTAAVLAIVLFSTAVAAYLPARRASRLDPLEALRYE